MNAISHDAPQPPASDRKDFARLHSVVRKGLTVFVDVGNALAEIRDRGLYKISGYATFKEYLRVEHDLEERKAYRLINASEIVAKLGHGPVLPQNVRQCRELECVPDEDLPAVWQSVVEYSEENNEPISAKMIRLHTEDYRNDAVAEREEKPPKEFVLMEALAEVRTMVDAIAESWPQECLETLGHFLVGLGESYINPQVDADGDG